MLPHIHLGPITIQTFGICFGLGFIAAGAILYRRLRELGRPPEWAYEMAFAAMVGGLVGARLDYLAQNYNSVKHDLVGHLFSGVGLVWIGGVVGGTIAVFLWAWRRGMISLVLLDIAAVPLAVGYACGRCGCQIAGDGDYGLPSSLPWAMPYPHGTVPTPPGVRVQPTPVYETITMGIVALVLWRLRDRWRPGVLFAVYLILSGLERFLVEFIRRNHRIALGLTLAQYLSLAMVVVGAGALLLWPRIAARRQAVVTSG